MRHSRWFLLLAALAVFPLGGCGDKGNTACEPCANAADCQSGLTCQMFRLPSGDILNLCGDANPAMTCPAP